VKKTQELFYLFVSLGLTAFGGPAAHLAMLHREVIEKKKWMEEDHFVDLIGATSLIPGPNSTEMVMHCGHHHNGVKGLFVAGISFIIPACLLTGVIAYFYTLSYSIPQIESYIFGVKPIVFILIIMALKKLYKKVIKNSVYLFPTFFSLTLCLFGYSQTTALFGTSFLFFLIFKNFDPKKLQSVSLSLIFLTFFKIGSILFGSGYVLISYLNKEIVENKSWLTIHQIADAIAFGQFTPGPVLSSATFVGYLLNGFWGAFFASLGIFLPSFFFVWLLNPHIPKMRKSKNFSLLLNCVNSAALGIMGHALVPLGAVTFSVLQGYMIFIVGFLTITFFPKISSIILVIIGIFLSCLWTLL